MVSCVSARVTVFLLTAVMVFAFAETWGVGRSMVTGQLPSPPDCFLVAGKLACSAADGALSTREGKGQEIPGGNKRRRSAAGAFPGPQAPTKEGLDGVERTPRIRRTATRKRRRQDRARGSGALRRRPLDPTAGRASGRPSTG